MSAYESTDKLTGIESQQTDLSIKFHNRYQVTIHEQSIFFKKCLYIFINLIPLNQILKN